MFKVNRTINEGMQSIGHHTFANSETLIPKSCFLRSDKLTTLELPNTITKIDDAAFNGCSSLTSIVIPSSVNKIGNEVFSNMFSATSKNYNIIFEPTTPPTIEEGKINLRLSTDYIQRTLF